MSKNYAFLIIALLYTLLIKAQEEGTTNHKKFGITLAGNYTLSGIGVLIDFEYQKKDHIFYTGPKIPISRTYIPLRNPFGWNLGYRYNHNYNDLRRVNFFFNADYQISISKAYSSIIESNKKNSIQELFIGYGAEFKLSKRLFIANVIGIGGYLESYYNIDLNTRNSFKGYDHLFKIFLNYKF